MSNGTTFQRRTTTGGNTSSTSGPANGVPYWARLKRIGNTFTSYVSSDGSNWTTVGSASISMTGSIYIGLAVTSHVNSELSTVTFDNVTAGSNNPVPHIVGDPNPAWIPNGSASFNLTVNGTGFVSSSIVRWNNSDRMTTFISATQITAAIPASDVAAPGAATVTVYNPPPGGGTSNGVGFVFGYPQPTSLYIDVNIGFAGIDSYTATVGNGGWLTIDFLYDFTPWGSTIPQTDQTDSLGKMDGNGQKTNTWAQNVEPGLYSIKAIKNNASESWVSISPVTYTVRPPKPTSFTLIPITLQLPNSHSVVIGNENNQIVLEEEYDPPVHTLNTYPMQMDGSASWSASCDCSIVPGTYHITRVRNILDDGPDGDQWLAIDMYAYVLACQN